MTSRAVVSCGLAAALLAAAPGGAAPSSQTDTFPTGLEGVGTIRDVALDAEGNVYAVSEVDAPGAVPAGREGFSTALSGPSDVWVAKFDPGGSLVWATYLGGSGRESPAGISFDPHDRVVVAGWTASADFPVVGGSRAAGGTSGDVFVARIAADGSRIVWSGTFGGSGNDIPAAVAVGTDASVAFAGRTSGAPFPVTRRFANPGATAQPAWIGRISADGDLAWAVELGGADLAATQSVGGVAIDDAGAVLVSGTTAGPGSLPPAAVTNSYHGGPADAFVVKVAPGGQSLDYAVYVGGAAADAGGGLALEPSGAAWLAGATQSSVTSFPRRTGPDTGTTDADPGAAFLVKLSPSGQSSEVAAALPATFWGAYDGLGRMIGVGRDAQGRGWTAFGRLMRFSSDATVVDDFGAVTRWGVYGSPRVRGTREAWCADGLSLVRVLDLASGEAAVPGAVTARAAGPRSVDVSWNARGNETAFVIERADATGAFAEVASAGPGVTAWTDTGLEPETNYRYRVRAVVGTESSSPSAFVTVRTGGSFGLRVESARLVNSPRARRDSLRISATATFAARERFDPATQALRITVGEGTPGAFVLDIPAGDPGWTAKGRRAIWRAPRALPGDTQVTLDTRRDRLVVTATRTDLPGLPADPARVAVRIGDDAASDAPVWVRRGDAMTAR